MPRPPILKRLLEGILSIGASPSESESQRGGRRVFMLAFILATLLSIPAAIDRFDAGYTWVGVIDLITLAIPVLLLVAIATHPTSYVPTLHVMFLVILAGPVLDTAMFGGLLPSGLLVIFAMYDRCQCLARPNVGTRLAFNCFAMLSCPTPLSVSLNT